MKVGDLVIEKTRMSRKPDMGIVLAVDYTKNRSDGLLHTLQIYFFDGEINWMREDFLEVVNESR
tara:strand:- start:104 stop:295 length:192 start_codon:yes stop_codon:yes gene_type:complete